MRRSARGLVILAVSVGVLAAVHVAQCFVSPPGTATTKLRGAGVQATALPNAAVAGMAGAAAAMAPTAAFAEWQDFVVGPLGLIDTGLSLFKYALGFYAILSWLVAFGIVDMRSDIFRQIQGFLGGVIDPVLAPLRSVIPPVMGFDISFMILWFVVEQAQAAAASIMIGAMTYNTVMYY